MGGHLQQCSGYKSFFIEKDYRAGTSKFWVNNSITKELAALLPLLHPDITLVVIGSKITKAQENAKWFKQLSATACRVNCLTPDITRLPQFIRARCKLRNLTPDDEALQMLSQWYEGNLLALNQSLEKLTLLYPDGELEFGSTGKSSQPK